MKTKLTTPMLIISSVMLLNLLLPVTVSATNSTSRNSWILHGVSYTNQITEPTLQDLDEIYQNRPTPSRYINRNTFPIGSRQMIDYAYALRVRTGPGNEYDILTFVHPGDEFEILDYSRRFVQISTPRGNGWIFAGFLSRSFVAPADDEPGEDEEIHVATPPKHVTEIPDLNINLSTYSLRFFYGTELLDFSDKYEAQYGIVRHEEQGGVFAIRTDTSIPNFDLIKVGVGGGDTGMIYFYPGEVLRSFEMFTPECALVVVTHWGTMPRIAITFVDNYGVRRYFTIQQCGRDGHEVLTDFPLDVPNPF